MTKLDETVYQIYDQLLQDAKPIIARLKESDRRRPPNFNIFRILGVAYREVSTHSAMLVHLLDPNSSHAQGTLFLEMFLEAIVAAGAKQGKPIKIPIPDSHSHWRIKKEEYLLGGLGQVDIIIRGPNVLILIENKVFAGDQETQLQRYWTGAKNETEGQGFSPIIVYLTRHGHPPHGHSLGPASEDLEKNLILLSYHEHIFQLVSNFLSKVCAVSVQEILRQYASLVKEL